MAIDANGKSCTYYSDAYGSGTGRQYVDFSAYDVEIVLSGADDSEQTTTPSITISDNKPMDYYEEDRGEYRAAYNHSIPFFGKAKPSLNFFGEIKITYDNRSYKVAKIKVNKKKKTIQITALEGADKQINRAIKKATELPKHLQIGGGALPTEQVPACMMMFLTAVVRYMSMQQKSR